MAEPHRDDRLLEWALGTFHATFFVLVLVAVLYRGGGLGDLLSGLSTPVGLAAFSLLWVVAWWSTRRALRRVDWPLGTVADPGALLGLGSIWGGVTGVLFLLGLVALLLIVGTLALITSLTTGSAGDGSTVTMLAGIVVVGLAYLAIASLVAFVLGLIVGTIFALLDVGLLLACRFLLARCVVPSSAGRDGAEFMR